MADEKMNEMKLDIEEMSRLIECSKRQRVKDVLSVEMRKMVTELANLRESLGDGAVDGVAKRPVVASSANKCYNVKLTNYAWDQSDKFVKLFVTLKNVQSLEPAKVFCKFTEKSVEVHIKELENRNYVLTVNNLLNEINVSKSHWKVKTDMVVVLMAKQKEGQNWACLVSTDVKAKETKMPSLDPDEDPYSGLMNFMKKIYDEGDDDMKRTIAKSWTESREKSAHQF